MLKQEVQKFLTDTLGMDLEALKKAVASDEEVEIAYKSGILMDDTALSALKETVKKEGYNEGKVAGVEIEAKRIKEKFGIEIEGKNFEHILSQHEKQILANAKIEPAKKVTELETSLQNLQKQYQTDIELKQKEIADLSGTVGSLKINNELSKYIPEKLTGVNKNQFMALAKMEYQFGFENDGLIAKKGETVIKDKLEKPLPVSDVLTDFAVKNGWMSVEGRGGGDDVGGGEIKTLKDAFDYMKKNNIDPYSHEGMKIQEKIK